MSGMADLYPVLFSFFYMDYSKYNFAEQAQINAMMEQRQMNDFVNMFTGLVDRCFKQCANDFTTKAVTGREVMSKRFGEISQQQSAFIDVLNQSINPSSL
ncbi:protein transporter tim9 [Rhizopus stolonifer]|uniref:Mitochondrial import inner membrane translocase subunit n=1 Tax=Rhizopus stolonifer TaxID=4846 RepID=A0A367KTD9_RHIST|nr:protein transporter tim9 [Rhizopus stolonifer]